MRPIKLKVINHKVTPLQSTLGEPEQSSYNLISRRRIVAISKQANKLPIDLFRSSSKGPRRCVAWWTSGNAVGKGSNVSLETNRVEFRFPSWLTISNRTKDCLGSADFQKPNFAEFKSPYFNGNVDDNFFLKIKKRWIKKEYQGLRGVLSSNLIGL